MSFFKSLGHFFNHAAHALFVGGKRALEHEPEVVAAVEAAGAGHFLVKPLEAQALITSIVGDILDARRGTTPSPLLNEEGSPSADGVVAALALAPDVVAKIDRLIALVKAHPEAPK